MLLAGGISCAWCKGLLSRGRYTHKRYCSDKCQRRAEVWRQMDRWVKCAVCKSRFTKRGRRIYCSVRCRQSVDNEKRKAKRAA